MTLRITIHDSPQALTFQLEGMLAKLWVQELEECWRSARAGRRGQIFRVDLTGVTLIDEAGKACLKSLHCQGAEFVAADCLTKAIVDEIAQSAKEAANRPTEERILDAGQSNGRSRLPRRSRPRR